MIGRADIELKCAMLCWNSGLNGGQPSCAVVRHPDLAWNSDAFDYTAGACYAHWPKLSDQQRLLKLLIDVWHVAAFYDVPAKMLHVELLKIPEYRRMLADDVEGQE